MLFFAPSTPLSTLSTRALRAGPLCSRRVSHVCAPRRIATTMVLHERETKPIRITGNNIQITESLRKYVNDKLAKILRRFGSFITKIDVHLSVEHNPSVPNRHKAEVVTFAGKTILRKEVRTADMYAAIDEAEERIARTIRKFKERKEAKGVGKAKDVPVLADDDDESDEEADDGYDDVYEEALPMVPPVREVVKRKVFPMPLQTVEEAVLCCEYVDHPWYLFRNAATSEISLVYKRNHGGYGLIEPSNANVHDEDPV